MLKPPSSDLTWCAKLEFDNDVTLAETRDELVGLSIDALREPDMTPWEVS